MQLLKIIINREFKARVRNKSFVVMTFMSPLLAVFMLFLITYLSKVNTEEKKEIAVYDPSGKLQEILFDTQKVTYRFLNHTSLEQSKELVVSKELFGLIYFAENTDSKPQITFYTDNSPGPTLVSDIEAKVNEYFWRQDLKNQGIDPELFQRKQNNVVVDLQSFSGKKTSKTATYVKMFFGGASGYLIMMFIVIYGNMVMRSVIEEKTNRIIEIIISSVKPFYLMLGKIIGTSLAGLLQFTIWIVLGFILTNILGVFFNFGEPQTVASAGSIDLPSLMQSISELPLALMIVSFFLYFIGGYFLYSAIYAAIGAAVDNETDTQQFLLPILLPLVLGVYVGFVTVFDNPHGSVATLFSIFPLTSPIVMLMRIPFGVPWWQLVTSLILLFVSFVIVVWFAGKIYRVGILMYGKKPTYKELYKWLKY
ncbi:MAG: ABC transporter permease [Flavobacteriaceae bacterium]|nr:ABC transporter permease [Flavobacteriaceae bacterium]